MSSKFARDFVCVVDGEEGPCDDTVDEPLNTSVDSAISGMNCDVTPGMEKLHVTSKGNGRVPCQSVESEDSNEVDSGASKEPCRCVYIVYRSILCLNA